MRRIAVLALVCAAFCGSASATITTQTTGSVGDPLYSIAYGQRGVVVQAVANAPGEVFGSAVLEDAWTIHDAAGAGPGLLRVMADITFFAPKDQAWATINIGGQEIHLQSTGDPAGDYVTQILMVPFTPEQPVTLRIEGYARASNPGETSTVAVSVDGSNIIVQALDGGPYIYTYSTASGYSYQFNNGQILPEPASAMLAIPALAGLWMLRRKRDSRRVRDRR